MDFQSSIAARTLWQEARGEPPAAQRAVAHVIVNRRNSGRWGNTLAAVCLSRSQFSAWGPVTPSNVAMLSNFHASCALADGDPELIALAAIVSAAESEPDPTGGATYYYNPKEVGSTPTFVSGFAPTGAKPGVPCGKFGNQLFFKDAP